MQVNVSIVSHIKGTARYTFRNYILLNINQQIQQHQNHLNACLDLKKQNKNLNRHLDELILQKDFHNETTDEIIKLFKTGGHTTGMQVQSSCFVFSLDKFSHDAEGKKLLAMTF